MSLHRTFHATRVRGDGVVFRLRQRIHARGSRSTIRSSAPTDYGLRRSSVTRFGSAVRRPSMMPTTRLWTVELEDVDVAVREIWVEMFRYQGQARAAGAFHLRPARRVWVGPAELSIASGDISAGGHDVMHGVKGRIGCRVDDFDVQAVTGAEVFRYISARTRMTAQVAGLRRSTSLFADPSRGFRVTDGSGPIDADVAIEHGVFTPDTRLAFRTQHIGVAVGEAHFRLDGELALLPTGRPLDPKVA